MLIASVLAFFIVIFLLATITVAIGWMAFLKERAEATEAATGEDAPSDAYAGLAAMDEDSPLFHSERLSTLGFWDSLLTRFDFVGILKTRIAQAELEWSVGRVTLLMLLSGTVSFLLFWKFLPGWGALLLAAGVAGSPYMYVLRLRRRRFERFREGFPDVLDSLARALRAGYPLAAAMESVAAETTAVVATEIRKTAAEANLGMSWSRALENMGKRMPLLEVNLFAAAVQLHARTGGKLSEVMGGLAENMREALSLRGEVRALAAHGRMTGIILTILPIGIATMMMFVSPDYMVVLYNHPWGKNLIAAAIGCLVLAHFVIRKIVDIEI
ncbi:MAG TPA: type II secretion system F family protein [Bryobacteraceae bacterium]|jgi:tight adherence protein B